MGNTVVFEGIFEPDGMKFGMSLILDLKNFPNVFEACGIYSPVSGICFSNSKISMVKISSRYREISLKISMW